MAETTLHFGHVVQAVISSVDIDNRKEAKPEMPLLT